MSPDTIYVVARTPEFSWWVPILAGIGWLLFMIGVVWVANKIEPKTVTDALTLACLRRLKDEDAR